MAVNPWGTQRLRLDEVASLRLGAWGPGWGGVPSF
ncbi:hypothetical protein [Streptomyces sp. NBC_00212]